MDLPLVKDLADSTNEVLLSISSISLRKISNYFVVVDVESNPSKDDETLNAFRTNRKSPRDNSKRHYVSVPKRSAIFLNTKALHSITFRILDRTHPNGPPEQDSNTTASPLLLTANNTNDHATTENSHSKPGPNEANESSEKSPLALVVPAPQASLTITIRLLEMDSAATSVLPVAVARVHASHGQHAFKLMALREEQEGEPLVVGEGQLTLSIPESFLALDGAACVAARPVMARCLPLANMITLREMMEYEEMKHTSTTFKVVVCPHYLLNLEVPRQCFFSVKSTSALLNNKQSRASTPTTVYQSNHFQWQDSLYVNLTDKEVRAKEALFFCIVDYTQHTYLTKFILPVQDLIPGEQYTVEYAASSVDSVSLKIIFSLSLQKLKKCEEYFYKKNPTCHRFEIYLHGIHPKLSSESEKKERELPEHNLFTGSAIAILRIIHNDDLEDNLKELMEQGLPIQKFILGDKFELKPSRYKFSVASRILHGYPEWSKNFEFNLMHSPDCAQWILLIGFYEMRMDRNQHYAVTFVGHSSIPLQRYMDAHGKGSTLIQEEFHLARKCDAKLNASGDGASNTSSEAALTDSCSLGRGESFEVALSLRHWTGKSYSDALSLNEEDLALDRRGGDRDTVSDVRKTSSSDVVALTTERSFHRRMPSEDRMGGSAGRVPLLRDYDKSKDPPSSADLRQQELQRLKFIAPISLGSPTQSLAAADSTSTSASSSTGHASTVTNGITLSASTSVTASNGSEESTNSSVSTTPVKKSASRGTVEPTTSLARLQGWEALQQGANQGLSIITGTDEYSILSELNSSLTDKVLFDKVCSLIRRNKEQQIQQQQHIPPSPLGSPFSLVDPSKHLKEIHEKLATLNSQLHTLSAEGVSRYRSTENHLDNVTCLLCNLEDKLAQSGAHGSSECSTDDNEDDERERMRHLNYVKDS